MHLSEVQMTHQSKAPSVDGFTKLSFWREESVGVMAILSPGHIDNVLLDELIRVLSIAAVDDNVSSLIVTGSNYIFSRGIAVPQNKTYPELRDYYKRIQTLVLFMAALEKPIFSAINGTATDNGLSLALLGDEVFVSENSKIILDKEEPMLFMGSLTIPQRIEVIEGTIRVKGINVEKENMMLEVFQKSKTLSTVNYHRLRKQRLQNLEETLLKEEIDFLDFYLWCEGCK